MRASLSIRVVLMSLQECIMSGGSSTPYVVCTATKRRSLQQTNPALLRTAVQRQFEMQDMLSCAVVLLVQVIRPTHGSRASTTTAELACMVSHLIGNMHTASWKSSAYKDHPSTNAAIELTFQGIDCELTMQLHARVHHDVRPPGASGL